MPFRPALLLIATLLLPLPAAAQRHVPRFDVPAVDDDDALPRVRALSVAKWASLVGTLGVAAFGFVQQREADDEYGELERACREDAERCNDRLPSGAFADPALEAQYQRVVDLDERARIALIGSQIGVLATIALFVLDMRDGDAPPNVPYDPDGLRVLPGREGGLEIEWRWGLAHPVREAR